jgi:hypothetical protein
VVGSLTEASRRARACEVRDHLRTLLGFLGRRQVIGVEPLPTAVFWTGPTPLTDTLQKAKRAASPRADRSNPTTRRPLVGSGVTRQSGRLDAFAILRELLDCAGISG